MKKWRNKITGEISEFMVHKRIEDSEDGNPVYAPFDGHIDEWCDYEEPKEYWYIDWNGEVCRSDIHDERTEQMKQIGNYFETKEEAEKAVEKLKAWKRLKDKGFRFEPVDRYEALCGNGFNIPITATMPPEAYTDTEVSKDLDICFGGEE